MAPTDAVSDRANGRRAILYVVVAVSALAVVAADPPNVRVSVTDVEAARPGWLIVAGLAAFGALLSLTLVHQLAQRATGLEPLRRELVRPTLQAQSLNMVTKSAGLAGMAAFTRHGTEQGERRGPVVAAYLLTDVAQQLSFSVILAIALFVRWSQGGLRGVDVAAGVVFALYGSATILVIATAARSREATRRVLGFPGRIRGHLMQWRPWRARRPGTAPGESSTDHRVADELYETVHLLRRSPRLVLPVVGAAVIPDVLFVVLLTACLRAVGSGVGLDVALVAFGVSALFGIIGFLPGGLGFVEVSLGAVLIRSGVRADQAAAAIVLYRIGEFWLPVGAGVLASPGSVRYWRPVTRVAAALLAAGAGILGLVEAAGLGGSERIRVGVTLNGAVRGDHFLAALGSLILLALAPSLWRGRRWALTGVVASSALILGTLSAGARRGMVGPLIVMMATGLAGHRAFRVDTDRLRLRSLIRVFVIFEASLAIYAVGGLYLIDENFRESTSLGQSIIQGARLLIALPASTIEPATVHGAAFIESVRLLAVTSLMLMVTAALLPSVRDRQRHLRNDARTIVEQYGRTALAHFQLAHDKSWVLVEEGMIAYHLQGTVALALGGPVGSPEGQRRAVAAFIERCEASGWIPAFHQVTEAAQEGLRAAGFSFQQIGAEAIIDIGSFTLDTPHFKSMRRLLRVMERDGLTLETLDHPISRSTMDELRAVSDAWMAGGGHRERTFTLGQFDTGELQNSAVLVVRDAVGTIVAFANVIPSYQAPDGNFDMMRRRPDAPHGVMDFLFLGLIEHFRHAGHVGMNLGLAPLALLPEDGAIDRGLQVVRRHGDIAFNFEGLYAYKNKWKPRWEPRFLAYQRGANLPAIARAVATVGELPDPASRPQRLLRFVRRWRVTLVLGGVVGWLMILTTIDPNQQIAFERSFGLAWADLVHLQLWRIFTAPLVQTHAGIIWSIVLLVFLIVPVAERRLGTRLTVMVFFLGDALSTIPILVALRVAGGLGNEHALANSMVRDSGSSSGSWALAAA
ncbi:MAG: phosphatidylglycerol lysyltransferase domain-containing protein, partial [Aquihabitans sp.]